MYYTESMILTRIIETNVLGALAYHYECDCGAVSKRRDHAQQALDDAQRHIASKHSDLS